MREKIGDPGGGEIQLCACMYTDLMENRKVGQICSIFRDLLNVSVDIVHNTASVI